MGRFNSVPQLSVGGRCCPVTHRDSRREERRRRPRVFTVKLAVGFSPLPLMLQSLPADQQGMLTFRWRGGGAIAKKNAPLYLQVMSCGHDAKASMD